MAFVAANTVARTMNGYRQVSPPRNAGFRQVRPARNAGFVRARPPVRTGGFVQMRVPVHALAHGLPIHPRAVVPNYTVQSPQAVPDMGGIDAYLASLLNQRYGVQGQAVPDMSGVDAYLAQLLASRHPYAGAQPV